MPALKTYDLFISHAWDRNDEYERLVVMLNSAPFFSWRNYSVPRADPLPGGRTLGAQLDAQVRPVNAVLILAGMYVNHRDWIQTEIDLARSYGKPIIGVFPWGQERVPSQVSDAVTKPRPRSPRPPFHSPSPMPIPRAHARSHLAMPTEATSPPDAIPPPRDEPLVMAIRRWQGYEPTSKESTSPPDGR